MIIQSIGISSMYVLPVYPNPTQDYIQFTYASSDDVQWQILAMDGAVADQGLLTETNSVYRIPVANLQTGLYMLQIISGDSMGTARFMVLH